MFEFLVMFAIGIALLLAVQSMDIECETPRSPARRKPVKHAAPPMNAARATR
jgi:hypothetical protein